MYMDFLKSKTSKEPVFTKLASFPELAPLPIIELDIRVGITYINPAARRMFPDLEEKGLDHPYLTDVPEIVFELRQNGTHSHEREIGVSDGWYKQVLFLIRAENRIRIYGFDNSARKQAEEALRRVAEEWRNTFDSVEDAIFLLDAGQRVLRCNKAAGRLFGSTEQEMLGRNCWEIVHHTSDPLSDCPFRKLEASHRRETMELQMNGQWYQVVVDPLLDEARSLLGAVHIVGNITQSKQVEESLRVSEQALKEQMRLVDMARDAVIIRDYKTDLITYWNEGAESMYGWSKQEAMGKVAHEILSTRFPRPLDEIRRKLHERGSWEGEVLHTDSNGKLICVLSRWTLQKDHDGQGKYIEINTDITERKAIEEQLVRVNESLEAVVEERTETLIRTNDILKLFSKSLVKQDYLEKLVGLIRDWCKCDSAGVLIMDSSGNFSDGFAVDYGGDFLSGANILSARKSGCLNARILSDGLTVKESSFLTESGSFICNDMSLVEGYPHRSICSEACCGYPVFSLATFPIHYEDRLIGCLHLTDQKKNSFDPAMLAFIESAIPTLGNSLYRFSIEEELRSSREELRRLSAHMLTVREEERTMISREIHDDLGQSLTAAAIEVSRIIAAGNIDEKATDRLSHVSELIDGTLENIHRICSQMRPSLLDHLGLYEAIRHETGLFTKRSNINCHMELWPLRGKLPEAVSTTLFRIFQEAMTNVVRHARAQNVHISIRKGAGNIAMIVRDDGHGIKGVKLEGEKRFGMLGMRERALELGGTVTFESGEDGGTTVKVNIPLGKKRNHV